MNDTLPILPPMPGQRLARGVGRLLRSMDHAVLPEFVPARGLRVDVMSLGPKGEIWIVECKSSRADFTSDRKWQAIWTGATGISGLWTARFRPSFCPRKAA